MKRLLIIITALYFVYAAVMCVYFLQGDLFTPSPGYIGTAADPHTFLAPGQINRSEALSRLHSLDYFLMLPLRIILPLVLIGFGLKLRNRLEGRFRRTPVKLALFTLPFLLVYEALFLPFNYIMLRIDRAYGLSNTSTAIWLSDFAKDFTIEWISTFIVVWVLFILLRRSPNRWWLWLWLLSIPVTTFIQFIQPVILDPLYNDFQPLQNVVLKNKILALAAKADIPAKQVFEVDMSARTNAVNAYVTGIGGNARIVLWDTTLKKLKDDEILTIMAHEMGHYKEKHIYWGLAFGLVLAIVVLRVGAGLYRTMLMHFGPAWGLRGERDMAALPLLLMLVSLLGFALTPVGNAFSRYEEHRADMYAMRMTGDGDAAVRSFQKIAQDNMSPVTQPPLVVWFLGSHPTIQDRIAYFEQFRPAVKHSKQ